MATAIEYGLATAVVAVLVLVGGNKVYEHFHKPPPVPTIAQSYAALKFNTATFKPTPAIVCDVNEHPVYQGSDEATAPRYSVGIQLGDKCEPSDNRYVATYDSVKIGWHVILKMDTTGQWWARPVGKRF